MAAVICLTNQKGGVGKTTTAVNLGVGLGKLGKRVLLVDLDPQANLTSSLGFKQTSFDCAVYDLLKGEANLKQAILCGHGVSLVPATIALSGADIELSAIPGRELLLKDALLEANEDFDLVLIDCPPTLGLLTLNALTAARGMFIPIQAEYLPLEGVKFLLDTVDIVRKRLNASLEVGGVIVTMYDARQNLHREVLTIIRDHFGDTVYSTLIRKNVALAEAPSFGEDIFKYKPDSAGAKDYKSLCMEFLEREVP